MTMEIPAKETYRSFGYCDLVSNKTIHYMCKDGDCRKCQIAQAHIIAEMIKEVKQ